jgi:hypothetical protein
MTQSYEPIISNEEDLARFKADRADADVPKKWMYAGRYSNGDAAAFSANISPAQKEGEATFSVLENGRVDMFLFL